LNRFRSTSFFIKQEMKRKFHQEETVSIIFPTTCFEVSRNLLLKYPETKLGKLVTKVGKKQKSDEQKEEKEEIKEFYFENDKFFPQIIEFYKCGVFPLSSIDENEMVALYQQLDFWEIKLTLLFETMKKDRMKNDKLSKKMVENFIDCFLERKFLEKKRNNYDHYDLSLQFYPSSIKNYKRDYTDQKGVEYSGEYFERKNHALSLVNSVDINKKKAKRIYSTFNEDKILSSISKEAKILIYDPSQYRIYYNEEELKNLLKSVKRVGNLHPLLSFLYEFTKLQEVVETRQALIVGDIPDVVINLVVNYLGDNKLQMDYEIIEENYLHYTLLLFSSLISSAQLFDEMFDYSDYACKKWVKHIENVVNPSDKEEELKLGHCQISTIMTRRRSKCAENRTYAIKYLEQKGIKAKWIQKSVSCRQNIRCGNETIDQEYEESRFVDWGNTFPIDVAFGSIYRCKTCVEKWFRGVPTDLNHKPTTATVNILRFSW
jgi:hypothetical protein